MLENSLISELYALPAASPLQSLVGPEPRKRRLGPSFIFISNLPTFVQTLVELILLSNKLVITLSFTAAS